MSVANANAIPILPESWTMEAIGRPDRKLEISKNEGNLSLYVSNFVNPDNRMCWTAELTSKMNETTYGVHCLTHAREDAIAAVEKMAVACGIARPREGA